MNILKLCAAGLLAAMLASCNVDEALWHDLGILREEVDGAKSEAYMAVTSYEDTLRHSQELGTRIGMLQAQLNEGGLSAVDAASVEAMLDATLAAMDQAKLDTASAKQAYERALVRFDKAVIAGEGLEDKSGLPSWLWIGLEILGLTWLVRGSPDKGLGGRLLAPRAPGSLIAREPLARQPWPTYGYAPPPPAPAPAPAPPAPDPNPQSP